MDRLVCTLVATTVAIMATVAPARADTEAAQKEEAAVQGWGAEHPACTEWSDSCVVCRRGGDAPACSTPGIACMPQPTACRQPADPKP